MGLPVSCSVCAAFVFCCGFVLRRKLLGSTVVCTELCCNVIMLQCCSVVMLLCCSVVM